MGVCDSLKIEIPGVEAPRIDVPNDRVTLSKMAYGYSVELSPLQLVTFYNAIANNGRMVKPMLVKRIERNGITEERFKTETMHSHICSPTALKEVQTALHDVVWDNHLGTASVRRWAGRIIGYKAQSDLRPRTHSRQNRNSTTVPKRTLYQRQTQNNIHRLLPRRESRIYVHLHD